jgi:hypothetical protein
MPVEVDLGLKAVEAMASAVAVEAWEFGATTALTGCRSR